MLSYTVIIGFVEAHNIGWQLTLSFNMMTSSNGNIFRVTGPLCGKSPVTGEIPSQRPVTRSFDALFDRYLNKQLRGWWFETPSRSLWCQSNEEEPQEKREARSWGGDYIYISIYIYYTLYILSKLNFSNVLPAIALCFGEALHNNNSVMLIYNIYIM